MRRFLTLAATVLGACDTQYAVAPQPAQPPPPAPQAVQVSFCPGNEPAWVAFQDGDGPWTRVTPGTAGGRFTYGYPFSTSRGGMATLQRAQGVTSLTVFYGMPAELATTGVTRHRFCGIPASKTLLGTVAGLDSNESVLIGSGFFTRAFGPPARDGSFELRHFPAGPRDLLAARVHRTAGQDVVTSFILRRDVDLPDSAVAPVFDFASVEAFPPALATLTVGDLGAEQASAIVRFISGTTDMIISPIVGASDDVSRAYVALPAARLRGGDLQELFVSAVSGAASRSAALFFVAGSDREVTLPAPMVPPTFDVVATTPSLRPRARFVTQADYDRGTSITYQEGAATQVTVTMTAAYAGVVGGYDLVVPELTSTDGFDPAWALAGGDRLLWIGNRLGGTLGLGADAVPVDGTTRRTAFASDSLTGL